MPIFTVMTWDMLTHSRFTPECFLTPTAKRKNRGIRKEDACERKQIINKNSLFIIEEIQQEKQAAFALNVEKMWPVLFLNCGCEEKRF